jgi:RHS repeat-associated protein
MSELAEASCQLTRVRDANSRSANGWPRNRTKYSYDAAGNTLSYGGPSFTYNNRGRMMSTSASSTNYLYSAAGQLVEKSGTLGTTVFMYDESGHVIGEYDGSGNLIEETVWLGDIPVATLQPNGSGGINVFYIHTDQLNAPRKIAQPTTDTLVWRWDTDPFGTAAPNQNPSGLGTFIYNLRFPGQYYMAETGLNQNVNRDYDPLTGKYVESDPIGLKGLSYSTYAYVGADPVSRRDPYGLAPCTMNLQQLVDNALAGTIDPTTGAQRRGGRTRNCAQTVRNDVLNAGGPFLPRLGAGGTPSPGAWGPTLTSSGCYTTVTDPADYTPAPGDIAITVGNGTSHVSIYDGNTWDADIATPGPIPSHGPNYAGAQVTYYKYVGPNN